MNRIKLAIQKSGRLSEQSEQLLRSCGIIFSNYGVRLTTTAQNFPVDLLYLRDNDIPDYVQSGVADLGIVGENILLEKRAKVNIIERLGFGRCRVSLAVPKDSPALSAKDLQGKRIATSYPVTLKAFMKKWKIRSDVHEISGSVEIAPGIGLSDAIMDIVSTGSTLMSNGLRELEVLFRSEAVLIANQRLSVGKQKILNDLDFRIQAVNNAKNNKYILLNCRREAVKKISAILPGIKSPTIMPLAEEGWVSLHSVVNENDFWVVIDRLRKAGAEGILICPIEKLVK